MGEQTTNTAQPQPQQKATAQEWINWFKSAPQGIKSFVKDLYNTYINDKDAPKSDTVLSSNSNPAEDPNVKKDVQAAGETAKDATNADGANS